MHTQCKHRWGCIKNWGDASSESLPPSHDSPDGWLLTGEAQECRSEIKYIIIIYNSILHTNIIYTNCTSHIRMDKHRQCKWSCCKPPSILKANTILGYSRINESLILAGKVQIQCCPAPPNGCHEGFPNDLYCTHHLEKYSIHGCFEQDDVKYHW